MHRMIRGIRKRSAVLVVDDTGMSTVEYAIGTVAAAAFGAILYTVVTGDSIGGGADRHHRVGAENLRLTPCRYLAKDLLDLCCCMCSV